MISRIERGRMVPDSKPDPIADRVGNRIQKTCCEAVLGAALQNTFARRYVVGQRPTPESSTADFAWLG